MIIDTEKIHHALKEGTAAATAEKFGMSVQTVKSYRSRETSSAYSDWRKMSIEKAEEIMKIINEEEKNMVKKYYAIFSGDVLDIENPDNINVNSLDLTTSLDRSFGSKKEAKEWIESVLKENVWEHYAVLMTVKETSNFSFDILEVEEFYDEK